MALSCQIFDKYSIFDMFSLKMDHSSHLKMDVSSHLKMYVSSHLKMYLSSHLKMDLSSHLKMDVSSDLKMDVSSHFKMYLSSHLKCTSHRTSNHMLHLPCNIGLGLWCLTPPSTIFSTRTPINVNIYLSNH